MDNQLLDDTQIAITDVNRRTLLPLWIKIFTWIFLIMGGFMPIALILAIVGFDFELAIYGLETSSPRTLKGFAIMLLITLKGIVAFGLWTEKKWAISLGIIDAIIGIIICIAIMIIIPLTEEGFNINTRLELVALIPYLIKMKKLKTPWNNAIERS